MVALSKELNEQMETKATSLDEDLICMMSYTCRGSFAPLCAALGGFVAQEGLKALTGKFTPLNQMVRLCMHVIISFHCGPLCFEDIKIAGRSCINIVVVISRTVGHRTSIHFENPEGGGVFPHVTVVRTVIEDYSLYVNMPLMLIKL